MAANVKMVDKLHIFRINNGRFEILQTVLALLYTFHGEPAATDSC
jgi:hypothetical protein